MEMKEWQRKRSIIQQSQAAVVFSSSLLPVKQARAASRAACCFIMTRLGAKCNQAWQISYKHTPNKSFYSFHHWQICFPYKETLECANKQTFIACLHSNGASFCLQSCNTQTKHDLPLLHLYTSQVCTFQTNSLYVVH